MGRVKRTAKALLVAERAMRFAASIDVEMFVDWQDEQQRLTFMIRRNDAPKGAGARAILRLVELADADDIEISLDVLGSIPRLVRYYWRFGFRICAGDHASETAGLAEMVEEQRVETQKARGAEVDFGVVTMWRDRWAGPLQDVDASGTTA